MERAQHTPPKLMHAIGVVESGRPDPRTGRVDPWPWTINAQGVGHFYETKTDAIAAAMDFLTHGVRSIDVGCMQVNLMYHPTAFATLDDAFEPATNAAYAARFLKALYHDLGTWPQATAAYHSQTDMGIDYARKVMAVWGQPMPDLPAATFAARAAGLRDKFVAGFVMPQQPFQAFVQTDPLVGGLGKPGAKFIGIGGFGPVGRTNRKADRERIGSLAFAKSFLPGWRNP